MAFLKIKGLMSVSHNLLEITNRKGRCLINSQCFADFQMYHEFPFTNNAHINNISKNVPYCSSLIAKRFKSHDNMENSVAIKETNKSFKKYLRNVVLYLAETLSADPQIINNAAEKHPKKKFIQFEDVTSTVNLLFTMGFDSSTILETVAICFYPQENVLRGFRQLEQSEPELLKFGLNKGFVENETFYFINGTKSKDKRLQLCLYFIEQPFCFSGSGIFSLSRHSKLEAYFKNIT